MPWWSWMVLGGVLLAAELMLVDAAFYLVFVGIAAILTGFGVMFSLLPFAEWMQWLVFGALAAVTMVLFRERLYRRLRPAVAGFQDGPEGGLVDVPQALGPGASCRAEWRGSTWTITNRGSAAIAAGARARILRRRGLGLEVAGEDENAGA